MDHNELARELHAHNKAVGWWDEVYEENYPLKYFIPTKLALVHSEISEAFYGWTEKDLDNHLPAFPMFHVELADTAIRTYDILGFYNVTISRELRQPLIVLNSIPGEFASLHLCVSNALEAFRKSREGDFFAWLVTLIYEIEAFSKEIKCDLGALVMLKHEYNKTRLDHKREARQAEGGKAI